MAQFDAQTKTITQAIERLGRRVTVGDVAAEAGLPMLEAQRGVLALASEVQAHLQVAESGEVAYLFPRNIQGILRSKSRRLRWQAAWEKAWGIIFYGIRISFGVVLIASLVLIALAIVALAIAASSAGQQQGGDRRRGGYGGGTVFMPRVWLGPNVFRTFQPPSRRRRPQPKGEDMNFLEAIFSFLFGDGDPNADLEERRWQGIAQIVRASGGAVVAEQVAPFLGKIRPSDTLEDFMVPVLSRFNGVPQVSPQGGIVYQFPELQVTAQESRRIQPPRFLQELPRKFSQATSGQIMGAIGLGSANLIGALVLGNLLQDRALVMQLGGIVALANSLYWLLLGYGAAFLAIPLGRYFWVQRQNTKIALRNADREQRAEALLDLGDDLREKLSFAKTLAAQTVLDGSDLAYTTETDLVDQEIAQKDKIDAEWQRLLKQRRDRQ